MEYLGMIIYPGEVQMDPGKVAAVKEWPTPTALKEVRVFVGFTNFYRRFLKDFATMAQPLHDLTKKDVPWHWNQEQQEAFDVIKAKFCEKPILKVYNYEIYDREMLGLIWALEDWQHFPEGIEFKVVTNHKNMEWWATMWDLNRYQAHWSLYLSHFNFKVTYKKGKSMQADALSRFSTDHVSDRDDNHLVHVLGPQYFQTVAAAHYKPANNSLGDQIHQAC